MMAESSGSNAEIERMERELQQIRINAHSGLIQLEQRLQSTGIEYDQLVHTSNALKEDLYREVLRMLDEVIKFKLHIQTGLEGLESELDDLQREVVV